MLKNSNKGQSLIVLVLIIAIVLAIISATSYRLSTQTQSTKEQENSVRALAAADTGIEFGLKQANISDQSIYKYSDLNINLPGVDLEKSRVLVSDIVSEFASPDIEKDSQFTFYIHDPTDASAPSFSGALSVFFNDRSSPMGSCTSTPRTTAAYELSFIYGTGNNTKVRREVYEPCSGGFSNGLSTSNTNANIDGVRFRRVANLNLSSMGMQDLRILIVRPLFASGKVGISGPAGQLPSQGKRIQAEAYTTTGASKIISILQSLPQIPAEFFVTSF